jgi:hypothetical protein
MTSARRALAVAALLSLVLATIACKDPSDSDSDNPGGQPPSGARRIAWDQDAESPTSLAALTYYVYVDSVRSTMGDARCANTRAAAGYECSGALPGMTPGTHVIELSAFNSATGRESARSAPLSINISSTTSVMAPPRDTSSASGETAADGRTLRRACVRAGGTGCFAVESLVNTDEPISSVTPLDGGRVLYVEGERRVRIWSPSGVSEAYDVSPDGAELLTIEDVAVAPSFERTHFVYFARVAQRAHGGRTLDIVRVREVGGVLGESAIIVPGVELSDKGTTALQIGPDELLYLAVSGRGGDIGRSGLVLRFDQDGSAFGNPSMRSPVLAQGVEQPAGLAWWNGRMWLGAAAGTSLSWLPTSDASAWPAALQASTLDGISQTSADAVRDLAASSDPSSACPLFVATEDPPSLQIVTVAVTGATVSAPIGLGALKPTSVGVSSACDVFLAVAPPVRYPSADAQLLRLRRVPNSARRD